jgi:hypothetical protein
MLSVAKKACKECPFRKDSPAGWLGGLDAEETLACMDFEELFNCHMERKDSPQQNIREARSGEQNICRGYLVSARMSGKRFGSNAITGKYLLKLTEGMIITDTEKECIMTRSEFLAHHKGKQPWEKLKNNE